MKINKIKCTSLWREKNKILIIDQRNLPFSLTIKKLTNFNQVLHAISSMQVRGAPLIGIIAAYGIAFAKKEKLNLSIAKKLLLQTRPTAINLLWAINYVIKKIKEKRINSFEEILKIADQMREDDINTNKQIGLNGLKLIEKIAKTKSVVNIITHCNAGWLATIDYGTALSPIYLGKEKGIDFNVWVSETRPRNQGYITSWELSQNKIKNTLITDNASGLVYSKKKIDFTIVGADRVGMFGHVFNKIGTFNKAVLSKTFKVPFLVAFPTSTIDRNLRENTDTVKIEERNPKEILSKMFWDNFHNKKYPNIFNPGFDITTPNFVDYYVTEKGNFKKIEKLKNDF